VPELGRWDDIFVFKTDALKSAAYTMLGDALRAQNGLAAKWTPRKGDTAVEIRKFFGMSPKQYRKSLVGLTNVVESQMCANAWDNINFNHVPSLAASRYKKAFNRHTEKYAEYVAKLVKGEAGVKVNAGAVYPYDVLKGVINHYGGVSFSKTELDHIVAQWEALPNFVGDANILPLVDVSGSMSCPAGKGSSFTCMDVAVSLGLYISERNVGPFKDAFITFSENPKLEILSGDLFERYKTLSHSEWGMSTNLESVFKLVLSKAIKSNVSEDEMPTTIIILSDMEFNEANEDNYDLTAQEMIGKMYSDVGYKIPKIVYWNINARNSKNKPVQFNTLDCALVSGFSPSLLKNILSGADMTPYKIMMSVIDSDRYKDIKI
jgi:hypothetical protein